MLWGWLLGRFPSPEQTPRRLWLLAGLALLLTIAASVLLFIPMHGLMPRYFELSWNGLEEQIRFSLLPTAVVLTLYESMYFFEQWKGNLHRADHLARAQTQAQLDALQSQLDPHFLFNNLNTLAALIEPDNAPAQQFVEQLADVYRYVLLAQGRPTVPLAEELAFIDTYLALHKTRFPGQPAGRNRGAARRAGRASVAPLSVQLLVENALEAQRGLAPAPAAPTHVRAAPDSPDFLLVENDAAAPHGRPRAGHRHRPGQRAPPLRTAGRGRAGGNPGNGGQIRGKIAAVAGVETPICVSSLNEKRHCYPTTRRT